MFLYNALHVRQHTQYSPANSLLEINDMEQSEQNNTFFFLEVRNLLWAVLEDNLNPKSGLLVVRKAANNY